MSTLHPKFTVSIYTDDVQFNEQPYDHNQKFAVHTVKNDYTNSMQATIDRFEAGLLTGKEFFARSTGSTFRQTKSLMSSPTLSPVKASKSEIKFGIQTAESQVVSPSKLVEALEESSRLKSKLKKDVELAKAIDSSEGTTAEAAQDSKVPLPYSSVSQTSSPKVLPKTWGKSMKSSSSGTNLFSQTLQSPLKQSLGYDPRVKVYAKNQTKQAPSKNAVIEHLLDNEGLISAKPELMDSIVKLREMQLLKSNQLSTNKFKGVGKIDYVYNEIHTRSTNPGYSRNTAGAFFYR